MKKANRLDLQMNRRKIEYMNNCISTCIYHPQSMHWFCPFCTRLSTKSKGLQKESQFFTSLLLIPTKGPHTTCIRKAEKIRIAMRQEGKNLRQRLRTAKGYLRRVLDFSLRTEQATRNPPTKKKVSTERKPASVRSAVQPESSFFSIVRVLTTQNMEKMYSCPNTTQTIPRDFIPLNTFILDPYEQLKTFIDSFIEKAPIKGWCLKDFPTLATNTKVMRSTIRKRVRKNRKSQGYEQS